MDKFKVKWTAADLNPNNIRPYCKTDSMGIHSMCWSCSDYIKKYKDEILAYEREPCDTILLIRELQANQVEIDKKLDRILALLEAKSSSYPALS